MWSNTEKLIAHVNDMCIDKFMLLNALQECTITGQLVIFCIFWAKGYTAKGIHEDMLSVCDKNCLS